MSTTILIDNKCFQSIFHLESRLDRFGHKGVANPVYQKRISRFLELIKAPGAGIKHEVIIDSITEENLGKCTCLILLTRAEPFTKEELDLILAFVQNERHSLLILSNHNPHEENDNRLTVEFGVKLMGGYWSGDRTAVTTISGSCLKEHPILGNSREKNQVHVIVTNTTCRIVADIGYPFLFLPDDMVGRWSSENEAPIKERVFGLIIDGNQEVHDMIKGKVVVLADSGFVGDKDSTVPGRGLIDQGDNELFIKNLIQFICP